MLQPLLQQYKQIQNALSFSGINSDSSSNQNTLKGATNDLTENTGELIAGQFGAFRITNMQILQNATQQLNQLVLLTNYAADIPNVKAILRDMQTNGIKIR